MDHPNPTLFLAHTMQTGPLQLDPKTILSIHTEYRYQRTISCSQQVKCCRNIRNIIGMNEVKNGAATGLHRQQSSVTASRANQLRHPTFHLSS
jgi:hypothetical protein